MLNDFKPTHDPNIDTFKVEYLIGGSAILAILFPPEWTLLEVFGPLVLKGGNRESDLVVPRDRGASANAGISCGLPSLFSRGELMLLWRTCQVSG